MTLSSSSKSHWYRRWAHSPPYTPALVGSHKSRWKGLNKEVIHYSTPHHSSMTWSTKVENSLLLQPQNMHVSHRLLMNKQWIKRLLQVYRMYWCFNGLADRLLCFTLHIWCQKHYKIINKTMLQTDFTSRRTAGPINWVLIRKSTQGAV